MAKKIAIIVLISVLILFCIFQGVYISSSYESLSAASDSIRQSIARGNKAELNASVNKFGELWEEDSEIWLSLILHEHVDAVFKNYLLVKTYAAEGDFPKAVVYLDQLNYALSDVYKLDQFDFKNIF